jgi:hypothetical protein
MVCRPATSEAGARRPDGAINCISTTYLESYHSCSTLKRIVFLVCEIDGNLKNQKVIRPDHAIDHQQIA